MAKKKCDVQACITELNTYFERIVRGEELTGEELASVVQQLTACEVAEGGPYKSQGSKNPDIGFNLVIARFLAACDIQLPRLTAYITETLNAGKVSSKYCSAAELEELVRWYSEHSERSAEPETRTVVFDEGEAAMFSCIRSVATARLSACAPELVGIAQEVMDRTMHKNHDKQMSLMSYYMREALGVQGNQFSDEYIAELGLANIFFWTAFIIYDDFWDEDEAAEPRMLPTANMFARHYTDFFTHLFPEETGFRAFFNSVMDELDTANTWETVYCRMHRSGTQVLLPDRLPPYGPEFNIKFYPAAGHVFGPVALLVELGYAVDSDEVAALVLYFKHYLIAMQLNDDAHDWKEDIERGHISTAVSLLLEAWQKKHPTATHIDLEKDMSELEQLFWFEVLNPLCELVLEHAERSRTALYAIDCIEDRVPLEAYITHNERIAREALAEQHRSVAFLHAFRTEDA